MDSYKDCGERFLAEKGIDIKEYLNSIGLRRYEIFALTDGNNFHRLKFYFDKNYKLRGIDAIGNELDVNHYIISIVLGHLGVVKSGNK